MKRISLVLSLVLLFVGAASAEELATATVSLPTLQCGMCKKTIESKVGDDEGIKSIVVDVDEKTATVTYDKSVVTLEAIEEAISKAGYDANETKADKRAQKKLHPCCQPGAHD